MESFLKRQRGYLLLIATVIIVIVGFVGGILAYMLIGQSSAATETLQAKSALYIAASGLELAKRDLIVNGVQCSAIEGTGAYTNASLFNGKFSVSGYPKVAISTLNQNITASAVSIPLNGTILLENINASATVIPVTNAASLPNSGTVRIENETVSYTSISGDTLQNVTRGILGTIAASHAGGTFILNGFSTSGIIWLDNELISYNGINGNVLQNAVRGALGTVPAAHLAGANISQNQCVLTAIGGVPDLTVTSDKRTLQQVLPAASSGVGGSLVNPTLISVGQVQMAGTVYIVNPAVTSSSPNFAGSTIVTTSTVAIAGTGGTKINSDAGLVQSSGSGNIKADIIQNYTGISSNVNSPDYLFNKFFHHSTDTGQALLNYIKANSDVTITSNAATIVTNLNNVNNYGKTIWVNGVIQVAGNNSVTVGSPTKPVVLIIDGGIQLAGSNTMTVYGLLYVRGAVQLSGTSHIGGRGMIATEGVTQLSGVDTINFDSAILNQINVINPHVESHYVASPSYVQEIFK